MESLCSNAVIIKTITFIQCQSVFKWHNLKVQEDKPVLGVIMIPKPGNTLCLSRCVRKYVYTCMTVITWRKCKLACRDHQRYGKGVVGKLIFERQALNRNLLLSKYALWWNISKGPALFLVCQCHATLSQKSASTRNFSSIGPAVLEEWPLFLGFLWKPWISQPSHRSMAKTLHYSAVSHHHSSLVHVQMGISPSQNGAYTILFFRMRITKQSTDFFTLIALWEKSSTRFNFYSDLEFEKSISQKEQLFFFLNSSQCALHMESEAIIFQWTFLGSVKLTTFGFVISVRNCNHFLLPLLDCVYIVCKSLISCHYNGSRTQHFTHTFFPPPLRHHHPTLSTSG